MRLYSIEFEDGLNMFIPEEECSDFVRAMELLSIEYDIKIVEEIMYAIHWYDYMDEEWCVIWCTEDKYKSQLADIIDAEVEYYVQKYNDMEVDI